MLSKYATALISPLGTALLLFALAWGLAVFRRHRSSLVLSAVALVWLYAWSTPVASHWLRGQMESEFPPVPVHALPQAQAVVVLGGGISPPTHDRPQPDLNAAADRVWHAARLYHAGKAPLVVLSGGADPARSVVSEAAAMRQLLRDLAVPDAAMLLEERSRNTEDNARETAALLQPRGVRTVLLVTSALHMRRARQHFVRAGLTVLPAATDHEARDTSGWAFWQQWLPEADALDGSGRAMKEWVGRWW